MIKFITIQTYPSRIEAELVKSLLASNGIRSVVQADDAGGMRPYPLAYTFGVELQVPEKDATRARQLISGHVKK